MSARTLTSLREEAAGCRACPLWEHATQTVFGEGPETARAMFVGEQPGDQEDLQGRPFVGPAGRVLDEALELAGIDRGQVYLTNAVKHFKWVARGKRRLHAKPTWSEQMACRPWLEAELRVLRRRCSSSSARPRRSRSSASSSASRKSVAAGSSRSSRST